MEDLVYHGQAVPPFYGNITLDYRHGNWSFYTNFVYKFGHYFKKGTINYYNLFENWEGHADYSRRWQAPGDENWTTVPSMIYPAVQKRDQFYVNSSANVLKADLVRFQDLRIGYTIGQKQQAVLKDLELF